VSCSKDASSYTLTVSVNPIEGGAVNPMGGTVSDGDQVSITATPSNGWIFKDWTGSASGNNKTVSIIMDSNKSVTANFENPFTNELTL
jgi:uncharacterized repeat protein (TIGR02543 family)